MSNAQQAKELAGKKDRPAVSLVIPTHPAWPGYKIDMEMLKNKLKDAEAALQRSGYDSNKIGQAVYEIYKAAETVDLAHLSKGLVLYASPGYHKVIYLPFEPVEKLIIDQSFETRDLVYLLKASPAYALLALSQNRVRLFEGQDDTVREEKIAGMPENIDTVERDYPSRVGNFTSTPEINEEKLKKFIRKVSDSVTNRYKTSDKLLIVAGTPKLLAYFRQFSHLGDKVIDYIGGNHDHITLSVVRDLVKPSLLKALDREEEKSLKRLSDAAGAKRLVSGPARVWSAAAEGRISALVIEKDCRYSGRKTQDGFTFLPDTHYDASSPVPDAVDEIIERTLAKGGDVVFTRNGALGQHQGIAAITRF